MATYEKYKQDIIRHEGNLADIVIELTNIDISESDVSIQVRKIDNSLVFSKSTLDSETSSDITISSDGTTITIILNPEDTKGHAGNHKYEIDVLDSEERPYLTIGGIFRIDAEINTD